LNNESKSTHRTRAKNQHLGGFLEGALSRSW